MFHGFQLALVVADQPLAVNTAIEEFLVDIEEEEGVVDEK